MLLIAFKGGSFFVSSLQEYAYPQINDSSEVMLNLRRAIRDFESVSAAWSEFLQQLHQIHEGLLNVPNISTPPRQRRYISDRRFRSLGGLGKLLLLVYVTLASKKTPCFFLKTFCLLFKKQFISFSVLELIHRLAHEKLLVDMDLFFAQTKLEQELQWVYFAFAYTFCLDVWYKDKIFWFNLSLGISFFQLAI